VRLAAAFAALALLSACGRPAAPPAPAPQPRYHLGEPYRMGGLWSYPREEFGLREQGIAEVLPAAWDRRRTPTGENFSNAELLGAHRTLQLPAVVTVTNLENGRSLRLRLVERGPETPGRVLGVSRRAAELLGATRPFQAALEVEGEASRAAIAGLPGQAPTITAAAAPTARVEREQLAPPPGAREASPRQARAMPAAATSGDAAPPAPAPLPETVTQGAARPGSIYLEGSTFFRRDLAQRQAASIAGGRAEPAGPRGPQQPWRVRAGPYASVAEADAALVQAMQVGLQEVKLVVE
jgi:rare lipoprotein A